MPKRKPSQLRRSILAEASSPSKPQSTKRKLKPLKITPESTAAIKELERLFQIEADNNFAIGDQLNLLRDKHGYSIASVAKHFGKSAHRLSEIAQTAKAFSKSLRKKKSNDKQPIPFAQFENARKGAQRFKTPLAEALDLVVKGGVIEHLNGDRRVFEKGFTDRSASTMAFQHQRKAKGNADGRKAAPKLIAKAGQIVDRCHHDDIRNIIPTLPPSGIKIAWLDPPYGQYRKSATGGYTLDDCAHGRRNQCDGNTEAEAISVVVDSLGLLPPFMAEGGVALLWQAAAHLRISILEAIDKNGWDVPFPIFWRKTHMQLGRLDAPWMNSCEICWMLWRKGDKPLRHDGSGKSNFIDDGDPNVVAMKTVNYDKKGENRHVFEKPLTLCERFILKHSYEGELLLDAFGCSGSFCIAAHRTNRHWIYVEKNAENFAYGSDEIAKEIAGFNEGSKSAQASEPI